MAQFLSQLGDYDSHAVGMAEANINMLEFLAEFNKIDMADLHAITGNVSMAGDAYWTAEVKAYEPLGHFGGDRGGDFSTVGNFNGGDEKNANTASGTSFYHKIIDFIRKHRKTFTLTGVGILVTTALIMMSGDHCNNSSICQNMHQFMSNINIHDIHIDKIADKIEFNLLKIELKK